MAGSQTLSFTIVGSADSATKAFKDTAANAALAARGAKQLSDTLAVQSKSAQVSATATLALADSDKTLADAEALLAGATDEATNKLQAQGRAADDAAVKTKVAGAAAADAGGGFGLLATPMGAAIAAGVALSPVLVTVGAGLGGLAAAAYSTVTPILAAGTATKQAQAALAGLDPAQRAAYDSLGALKTQFSAFSKSLEPEVLTLFDQALSGAGGALRVVQPIAAATGKALSGVLSSIGQEMQSGEWQNFFGFMERTAGPDVQLLGGLFVSLAADLPPLLESLQPVAVGFLGIATDALKAVGALESFEHLADQTNQLAEQSQKSGGSDPFSLGAIASDAKKAGDQLLNSLYPGFTQVTDEAGKFAKSQGDAASAASKNTEATQQQAAAQRAAVAAAAGLSVNLATLEDNYGLTAAQATALVKASGQTTKALSGSDAAATGALKAVEGYANAALTAKSPTQQLAGDVAVLDNNTLGATAQLNAFSDAWNLLVGNAVSDQQAVLTTSQAFQTLVSEVKTSGSQSLTSQSDFLSYVSSIGQGLQTLEKNGASVATVNAYYKTNIDRLNALHNLTPAQRADIQGLTKDYDTWSASTGVLNSRTSAAADVIKNQFTADLKYLGSFTPQVNTDVNNLARAVLQTGNTSSATRDDRAKLIADLHQAGIEGQTATTLVNGLQKQIDALRGKTVGVGVVGSGSGTITFAEQNIKNAQTGLLEFHAAGGRVGGHGSGDTVPAMLTPGEVVIPTGMVKAGAVDHLRGRLPGFAGGGLVGPFGVLSGAGQDFMGTAMTHAGQAVEAAAAAAMVADMKAKVAAAAAAAAAAGTPVPYSSVAGVTQWEPDVSRVLSMLGLPQADLPTVMSQMLTESGGNPNAINLCLTLEAMILTRRGLIKHDDVRPGDETIGYNFTTGRNEWTRVTAVHHYEDAPLVRIGNSRWHATATPQHRWVNAPRMHVVQQALSECPECGYVPVRTSPRGNPVAVHRAKAHGVTGSRQQFQHAEARFTATQDIRSRDRLVLSAVADTGPGLEITEREAAILGWIAGDGHVEKYVDQPRGRKKPSISIAQSKPAMVEKLAVLLEGVPCAHYTEAARLSRVNKKPMSPRHQWRLDPDYAQDLMRRAGHPKEGAVAQVLGMSATQRRAWLDAFIDAEGHRNGEYVTVTQAHGPVLEAAHLAIYLCGYRPRLEENARENPAWSPTARISAGRPVVSGSFLTKTDAGRGPVWCVTTELGSWTAEQDGQVFLTGNSDSNAAAGDPSKGLMQVISGTFAAYRNPSLSSNIYDPLANIYAGVNYAVHRYGNPGWLSVLGHGHGYDSGGYLPTGWSMAYNGTGRPEPVIPAGRGGGAAVTVVLEASSSGSEFDKFMLAWVREHVRTKGGGNVQTAFGRS